MLLEIDISRNDANQRVDRYMRKLCPRLSLSRLHYLFRNKEIKIESRAVTRNYMLGSGDKLKVYGLRKFEMQKGLPAGPQRTKTGSMDISVIYEDDDLLVVNKPGNITVHPGSKVLPGRSVIEKVTQYLGTGKPELFRPSLIHRLDKETSGALLIAKTGIALRYWTGELRKRKLRKSYMALVSGIPRRNQGTIESRLSRTDSKSGGAKSVVDDKSGQYAKTRFKIVKKYSGCTLLTVRIDTGRLHQIRSHLEFAGFPVLGDSRYGDFKANRSAREKYGLKRAFLHAVEIEGKASDGKPVLFKAGLPRELQGVLDRLKGSASLLKDIN